MPFGHVFPRPFTGPSIRDYAPTASGVYGISNALEWLYIGESDNIQEALLGHLREPDNALLNKQPTGFVFEICDSAKRPAAQDRLVLEYAPACNRRLSSSHHGANGSDDRKFLRGTRR